MDSAFSSVIPDSSLAAIAQLSENSRLGFATKKTGLHQGIEWSKSTLALGLPEWAGKTVSGPAVAANNFPNVTAGPAQPPPLKPRCTGPALWAGLKAAGQAFIPVPPLNNLGDPVGAMADFANDGATKAATAGVLYELATGARVLAPALDLAVDAIPVVGWAIVGAQTVNALWQGGVAYKQSIDQCYGGG
jgi:hypothetical protein